ncbi:MAG: amine oxidase, partial [Caulobacter sp.]|nr:amine oxidase [Caulobacter sp.]
VVRHDGPRLRLETARGDLSARAAVICVSTAVLASERLRFEPGLPDKLDAAHGLPLGLADKVFLHLDGAEPLPEEVSIYGDPDKTATGGYHLRPFGRPVIEAFFGGRHARALEAEGPGAAAAFAIAELTAALGADVGRRLTPLAATAWAAEPYVLGGYSHALPGRAGDRARLAAPVEDRLFFAGEACSAHAFSTAHGAWETGLAAAEAALAALE